MLRFLLALLMWTMSTIESAAADGGVADIDQLFTTNVAIIDYGLSLPDSNIGYDNDARLLFVGDRRYPYPEVIVSVTSASQPVDERITLIVRERILETVSSTNDWQPSAWYFDTQTQSFARVINHCIGQGDWSDFRGEDAWIFVSEANSGLVRLCEPTTGTTSAPLPAEFTWEIPPPFSSRLLPVFSAPNGQWLLLFGEYNDQTYSFSCDTSSDTLLALGVIPCDYCLEPHGIRWFETIATIWSWSSDTNTHTIYTVDVTRANSLEQEITRIEYLPEYYADPPRYDYVNFTLAENIWDTQCERVIYDVLADETRVTEMGSVCRLEYGSQDGVGYYRDVTRGAEGIAALIRFDARTGDHANLYEGEIELIEWVSPDEHYAAVVLGSNGQINIVPFLPPQVAWGLPEPPKLAYLDLVNDIVVFEHWTGWRRCDAPFGGPDWSWSGHISDTSVDWCRNIGPTGSIMPRADGTLLVVGTLEAQHDYPYTDFGYVDSDPRAFADVVNVQAGQLERTRIAEGYNLIPFSADYLLQQEWDHVQRTLQFILIPVAGGSPLEITTPIPIDDYQYISLTDIYPSTNQLRFTFLLAPGSGRNWSRADVTVQIVIP